VKFSKRAALAYISERVAAANEVGCRIWTGTYRGGGYPSAKIDGQLYYAHRLQWELLRGPLPEGICVCHHCDVPGCMNIEHHFAGTLADNNHDRDRKGRTARQCNEAHGMARLSDADVEEIRLRRLAGETYSTIASECGVSRSHACNIVNGRKRRLVKETSL